MHTEQGNSLPPSLMLSAILHTFITFIHDFMHTDAAAGGADDWAYGVAGIPYVYTIELRDTGRYGFILPKEYITPTGEEFYDGLKHYALNLIPDKRVKV